MDMLSMLDVDIDPSCEISRVQRAEIEPMRLSFVEMLLLILSNSMVLKNKQN